jgi:endonuclease/exonuclease/phosphatase family metal-dependent hydrolase
MNFVRVLSLVVFLTACGSGDDPNAPTHAFQLRVMTWNAAFLTLDAKLAVPPTSVEIDLKGSGFSGLDKEDRAIEIALGVLRADPDVIVFNEVFSEIARDELVNQLSPVYPHYVSLISAEPPLEDVTLGFFDDLVDVIPGDLLSYAVEPLDSGLMLFSRFPLMNMPPNARNDAICMDQLCRLEGNSGGSFFIDDKIAFVRYDEWGGLDGLASKGAAMVKLDTPGQPTFVVFTHMQADEGDVYAIERADQYRDMRDLLKNTLTVAELKGAPVYVAGDLNTPGGSGEWGNRFDPDYFFENPFFACGNSRPCEPDGNGHVLVDAWGFETSPTDPGKTSSGGNRLDYVLHGLGNGRLCMEHIRIPWEVADGGEIWYSDHKPVLADMNVAGRWCSANRLAPNANYRPAEFVFGGTDCDDNDPANPCDQDKWFGPTDGAGIMAPGGYQWFVIDQPGSYSVSISSSSVEFDIYHHTDLSRPLLPYDKDEGEYGLPFAMPDPPYYIRTFAVNGGQPDRTLAGVDYTLSVHQHLCREPLDACFLPPQYDVPYNWPDQSQGIADVMEIWYRFKTSSISGGRLMPPGGGVPVGYPDLRFLHESVMGACLGDLKLVEYDDPTFPGSVIGEPEFVDVQKDPNDTDWDDDMQTDERWVAPDLDGKVPDEMAEYFLNIGRTCRFDMQTMARMETTLTWFKPDRILCELQYDDSGVGEDDLVRFDFTFDKPGGGSTPACENSCDFEYEFDEAWPEGWQTPGQHFLGGVAALKGYYVDAFYPNLFEDEGDASDPDARLSVQSVSGNSWSASGMEPLSAIRRELPVGGGMIVFADSGDIDDADYWYEMKYQLNHTGPIHETP